MGPEDITQEFRSPLPEDAETREFHEDIMRMVERLNQEEIDIMGADGFIRLPMLRGAIAAQLLLPAELEKLIATALVGENMRFAWFVKVPHSRAIGA